MVNHKFFHILDVILITISALTLAFIAGLTIIQVFHRYVLNDALSWSAELTRIGFIWMTFIGSAVAINRRRHLRIDTFVGLFSRKVQIVLDIVVHVLIFAIMVFLAATGYNLSLRAMNTMTGALMWPRTVFFAPLAIGALFMAVFSIRVIAESITQCAQLIKGEAPKESSE
jgi:TRAP-type C4-dicarboxylate transport system permease small subunit